MLSTCVVIPCIQKHIPFLNNSIQSVVSQINTNITSIIVEVSGNTCPNYLEKGNIQVFCRKNRIFAGAARNSGLKRCPISDYITFLDADDELLPYSVYRMAELMKKSNSTVGLHDYIKKSQKIINGEKILKYYVNKLPPFLLDAHMGHVTISYGIKTRQNEKMKRGQDSEFIKDLVTQKNNVLYTPEKLSIYKQSKESAWNYT